MQTKTISELKDMFNQMDANGLGNDYREFVELKGNVVSDNLVETPFSNKNVAYCQSKVVQVTETKEQYRDSNGSLRSRTSKHENTISEEKSSQEISMLDSSSNEPVVLEINGIGCKLDITTKSEEDLVNKSKQNAMISLIGGIIAIVLGIILFIS